MTELSPARQLVDLVWENNQKAISGHSWQRLNRSMRHAVVVAIDAGLPFNLDDFEFFSNNYRMYRWGGSSDGNSVGERFYGLAVEERNMSACKSFENWKKRKPFIFQKERIYVGKEFKWNNEIVMCTSFSEEDNYLVACSYKDKPKDDYSRTKIKHRYKITIEELKKEEKKLKTIDDCCKV